MLQSDRILWPMDFSRCAKQALGHAVHFARQYGAELHMLHVMLLMQYEADFGAG